MFSELARLLGLKTPKKKKETNVEPFSCKPEQLKTEVIDSEETPKPLANKSPDEPLPSSATKKSRSTAKGRQTKNGLKVLSGDFDFHSAFCSKESSQEEESVELMMKTEKEMGHVSTHETFVQEFKPSPAKAEKQINIRKDKKGIPQISAFHDLEKLMETGINDDKYEYGTNEEPIVKKEKNKKPLKDRNRIPILSNTFDLSKEFGTVKDNEFQSMLEINLTGKTRDELLRKKKEKTAPPPIPVEQRIKRYPNPQEELDLHGFTAIEADRKTDVFIRSARRRDLFTVKIIVGKGIHSQGRAVLPDVVEDRLSALKNEKEVLTFRWEKRLKAQSGAVIVYLNHFD